MKKKEWALTGLYSEMQKDLNGSNLTPLERQTIRTICEKEIWDLAKKKISEGRKLTPGEQSVLDTVGR